MNLYDVAYANGLLVAVGWDNSTSSGVILTSPDGINWTQVTPNPTAEPLHGVTHGPCGWVAVGANGTVLISPNGTSWTAETSNTTAVLRRVAYGAGRYVAVGQGAILVGLCADGSPDLAVSKTVDGSLVAGQPGSYQIVVSNVGVTPVSGPVVVTDTLGPGLNFASATGAGWTCTASGQTVTCTHPGPVPAGGSLPAITLHVNVAAAPASQLVVNCATVAVPLGSGKDAAVQDTNPANDRSCVDSLLQPGGECAPLPAGAVAWWPLNEATGATAVSDIGGGHVGAPMSGPVGSGGPSPTTGMVGGALYFISQNTYVRVPDSPALNFGTGDFTIDAWVNPVQVGPGRIQPIVDKTSGGFSWTGYRLWIENGNLHFAVRDGNTGFLISAPITYGTWQFIAAVRTANSLNLYINGSLVATGSWSVTNLGNVSNTADLWLGGITSNGFSPAQPPVIGEIAIDELEIFNRALTPQEIQAIYQAGSAGKCRPQPSETGRICITKFEDLDGDGVQDPGEPLLSGWTFNVTDQTNHLVGTIMTTPPGTALACLTVAAPGTYTVTEQVQAGWVPTAPALGSQTVTVLPGQTVHLTFGNKPTGKAEICIFKFHDLDGDGKHDPNEPGLPGWPFTVSPAPLPPTTSPITTGPQGLICFGVTAPGTYTITEMVQPGWTSTTPSTQTVTITPGQLVHVLFGNKKAEGTADLGDAPDSTNHINKPMTAYTGVLAKFPTVFDPATGLPQGPKHLQPKGLAWLGKDVSFEDEADLLPDADGVTNIDPGANVADRDKYDDGVLLPIAIPFVCGQTQFQYTVTSTAAAKLYVNVWIDFNRDGDWDDPIQKCPLGPATTGSFTEWAVQNELITVPGPGTYTFTTPPFGAANLTKGSEMWMRITLTDQPIAPVHGADGSGPTTGYKYGETEDYLLRLEYGEICGVKFHDLNGNGKQDPGEPGLSDWVIEVKDAHGNIMGYAVTDANGKYCIVVPSPGTYTITEQVQPGWTPTTPTTQTVTVAPGQTVGVLFGNREAPVGRCDLAIRKDVRPNPVPSGGQVTVTLTVSNVGTAPCAGPTTLTETIPTGLSLVSVSGTGWTCLAILGNVICTYPGTIPAGGSTSITLVFTVNARPGTRIENCATLSNANDTNPANNRDCAVITVTEKR